MPLIPAFRKQKQLSLELEAIVVYLEISRPARVLLCT